MSSASQKILFAPSNENQARIFLPVARELRSSGRYEIEFIIFDRFYAQNAGRVLSSTDFSWFALPCSQFVGDWCVYEDDERTPFLREAQSGLTTLLQLSKPQLIIVGNDTGPIEQLLLRTAEGFRIPTCRIQDGFQASPPLDSTIRSQKPVIGDGGCDLNCVWSKVVRHEMQVRGVKGEIVTTGNPRFDVLASARAQKPSGSHYRVLLAAQCFARYGEMSGMQEISIYERISRLLLKRPDVHVILKLHPQTDLVQQYMDLVQDINQIQGDRVELMREGDSLEVLQHVDAVVTISSTVSVEAALLDLPTCRLNYIKGRSPDFVAGEKEFLEQILSPEFPKSLTYGVPKREKFVRRHHRSVDGTSTARVVSAIEKLLKSRNAEVLADTSSITPQLSAIVSVEGTNLHGTLQSILRETTIPLEVLVATGPELRNYTQEIITQLNDSRVRLCESDSISDAIARALQCARGAYFARIDSGIVLHPEWAQTCLSQLNSDPNYKAVFTAFALRNENGVFSHLIGLDPNQAWEDFVHDAARRLSFQAFLFRRPQHLERLLNSDSVREGATLATSILGTDDRQHWTMLNQCAFFTSAPDRMSPNELRNGTLNGISTSEENALTTEIAGSLKLSVIIPQMTSIANVSRFLSGCRSQTLSSNSFELIVGVPQGLDQKSIWSEASGLQLSLCDTRELTSSTLALSSKAKGSVILTFTDRIRPEPSCFQAHVEFHNSGAHSKHIGFGKIAPSTGGSRHILTRALIEHDVWPGFSLGGTVALSSSPFPFCANMSVRRTILGKIDVPINIAHHTLMDEDILLGFRAWELGCKRIPVQNAVAILEHTPTIQDYIEREMILGTQIAALLPSIADPEKRRQLLGTDQQDKSVQQIAEENAALEPVIGQVIASIQSVQHQTASGQSAAALKAAAELAKEVADAVLAIGHFTRAKVIQESSALSFPQDPQHSA